MILDLARELFPALHVWPHDAIDHLCFKFINYYCIITDFRRRSSTHSFIDPPCLIILVPATRSPLGVMNKPLLSYQCLAIVTLHRPRDIGNWNKVH